MTSAKELDRVQRQLAAALERARDVWPIPDEPTGIRVDPAMRKYVEKRSA